MSRNDPFLIWVGDTHTYPGGNGLVPKYAITSVEQEFLWGCWLDVIRRTKTEARKYEVITCFGGDMVDRPDSAEAIDLAVDVLKPLVNLSARSFGIYGTPWHVGESGKEDRGVYGQLGIERKDQGGQFWLSVGGQLVNWAHHGLAVADDPYRELDGCYALAKRQKAREVYRGYPVATAIVRHHRHLVPTDDLTAYGKKVRVVGCFKMPDSFGHKVAPGILPDIGVLAYWPREHRFETWRYPIQHKITAIR